MPNSHYWSEYAKLDLSPLEILHIRCGTCTGTRDYRRNASGALMIGACPTCEGKRIKSQNAQFYLVMCVVVVLIGLLIAGRYVLAVY